LAILAPGAALTLFSELFSLNADKRTTAGIRMGRIANRFIGKLVLLRLVMSLLFCSLRLPPIFNRENFL